MKKLFVLVLCVVFLGTTLLAGCQGNENNNNNDEQNTQNEEQNTNDETANDNDATDNVNNDVNNQVDENENESNEEEKVTIKFYSWQRNFEDQLNQMIEDFESENENIEVILEIPVDNDSNEYVKKLDMMITAGEDIDVLMHPNTALHLERAERGIFAPFNEYAKNEGIVLKDVYTAVLSADDGKVYGLPSGVTTNFVMLNKDHLDAANLPLPDLDWTWDDYREYAIKLSHGEGRERVYGSYMHTWGYYHYVASFTVFEDNPFFHSDGSLRLDAPVFEGFLKYKYELENEDRAQMPFYDVKAASMGARDAFFNGEVSMQPIGSWAMNTFNDPENNPHDFKIAVAAQPRWSKDDPIATTPADSHFIAINAKSKKQEAAYKFIRYYTTKGQPTINSMSAWKEADNETIINKILGENAKERVDVESIKYFFDNRRDTIKKTQPPYNSEVESAFIEEAEKYLVGGQEIDETMENIHRKTKAIVEDYNE